MNIVLRPFDVDEALDGAKLYTRNGLRVSQLKAFADDEMSLIGVIHMSDNRSILGRWSSTGVSFAKESLDLFIDGSDTTFWANIYKKEDKFKLGKLHANEQEAIAAACSSPIYFGSLQFNLDDLTKLI